MDNITIGKIIRSLRKNANLTQKQLALKLNKSESAIRMWELDKNKPTVDSIKELSNILDISYSELMVISGYWTRNDINKFEQHLNSNESVRDEKFKNLKFIAEEVKEIRNQSKLITNKLSNTQNKEERIKLIDELFELLKVLEEKDLKFEQLKTEIEYNDEQIKNSLLTLEMLLDSEFSLEDVDLTDINMPLEKLLSGKFNITLNKKALTTEEQTDILNIISNYYK